MVCSGAPSIGNGQGLEVSSEAENSAELRPTRSQHDVKKSRLAKETEPQKPHRPARAVCTEQWHSN